MIVNQNIIYRYNDNKIISIFTANIITAIIIVSINKYALIKNIYIYIYVDKMNSIDLADKKFK